jgi:hypothetical protein
VVDIENHRAILRDHRTLILVKLHPQASKVFTDHPGGKATETIDQPSFGLR